jgi:hypothetical protein
MRAAFALLRRFSDQELTLTDAVGLHLMASRRTRMCWSTDFHMGLTKVPLVIYTEKFASAGGPPRFVYLGRCWGKGTPLLGQEGWLRHQEKYREASESAQTGWSVRRIPTVRPRQWNLREAADSKRRPMTTPSAPQRNGAIYLMARPPLLSQEGNALAQRVFQMSKREWAVTDRPYRNRGGLSHGGARLREGDRTADALARWSRMRQARAG